MVQFMLYSDCVCCHVIKSWVLCVFDPQALLDIYLLDNIDEAVKHAIVSFIM